MKRGLVLGKFMPLHKGHLALVDFALQHCDELIILVCASEGEPISGEQRLRWVQESIPTDGRIKPVLLPYDERILPNTSVSSQEVSKLWAEYLLPRLPKIDIFFASEQYAVYMASFLGCDYKLFDIARSIVPVSATDIRQSPYEYWDFITAAARPYYVKKICLYGSESTGKTTLTEKLAKHFNTAWVPEMAREILEHTYECRPEHLGQIAALHAKTIQESLKTANKLLFVDTDINITRSYSRFLFDAELEVPPWVEAANHFDLHLYLDTDAPYVQDGTRLSEEDRLRLNSYHREELMRRNTRFELLTGSWEEKFGRAVSLSAQLLTNP